MSLASRNAVALVLAAGAALACASVAAAQSIVVRSTGPSAAQYPQGKKLPDNSSVTLKPGDKLTVLDKSGTRVLSGPGSFKLNGAVERTGGASLAAMVSGGSSRVRTGAVRGAPAGKAPSGPDSIWQIDVTKAGTYCIPEAGAVVLWRPNRTEAEAAKITGDGKSAPVRWGAGSALKVWPVAEVPVADGKSYVFAGPDGKTVDFKFRMLETVPEDQIEVASLLASKGCTIQLDMIAAAAAATSGATQ